MLTALGTRPRFKIKTLRALTVVALLAVFAVIGALTANQLLHNDRDNRAIIRSITVRNDVQQVFVLVQGAEAGQRGFLLTAQEKYLAPYEAARTRLPGILKRLKDPGNGLDQHTVTLLTAAVSGKMAELAQTVMLKRAERASDAADIVSSGAGYYLMTQIRDYQQRLQHAEDEKIAGLRAARDNGLRLTFIVSGLLLAVLIGFLALSMMFALNSLRKRNQSLRQLAAAKREAEDANRAKSEFLASMSHELRTPLNAIMGFSEVIMTQLLGPVGSPQYREYAEHIHKSGCHLLDLINDVLDLSKINAGKMELREQEISIPALIFDSLALVRGRAAHLQLIEQATDKLPHIWGDSRLLKQILVNLLTNAIKFTPPGGAVTIGADVSADGIRFTVEDTGIGMKPNDIAKAMSQYGQVDSKVARDHQGTGLGLPICKSLAELHGGMLEVISQPGVGTTVTMALPASRILQPIAQAAS